MRGYEQLGRYAERVGIPIERTGALLVAWSEEQLGSLPSIVEQSHANGYEPIRELSAEELYRREPHLGPGALGALEVPDEGIICPFTTPLAFATEAVLAGCELAARRRGHGPRAARGRRRARARRRARVAHALLRERRRAALGRARPHARARRLHGHASARRADRLRQALAPARLAHRAGGADQDHEGRADRPDRLRQRHARPDRRGRRAQGRHQLDGRRPRLPARGGPADRAGPARAGGDGRLCRAARGDRARGLPGVDPRGRALRLRRRHPLDRPLGVDGDRRARARARSRMRASRCRRGRARRSSSRCRTSARRFTRPYARRRADRAPTRTTAASSASASASRAARSATPSARRSRRSTSTACAGAPARTWAAARASSAGPSWRRSSRSAA